MPESKRYYDKKRAEGKKHNQAIRALGRHLCRVIFSMLKHDRGYEYREQKTSSRTPTIQSLNTTVGTVTIAVAVRMYPFGNGALRAFPGAQPRSYINRGERQATAFRVAEPAQVLREHQEQ